MRATSAVARAVKRGNQFKQDLRVKLPDRDGVRAINLNGDRGNTKTLRQLPSRTEGTISLRKLSREAGEAKVCQIINYDPVSRKRIELVDMGMAQSKMYQSSKDDLPSEKTVTLGPARLSKNDLNKVFGIRPRPQYSGQRFVGEDLVTFGI